MRELILFFSYIVCAFIPVFIYRRVLNRIINIGMLWITWLLSLTGAFFGGYFGTLVVAHFGLFWGFPGSILFGLIGAWIVTSLFIHVREIPDNW